MSQVERTAVMEAAAALDAVMTDLFCSTRTMVASLGWMRDDHVHVHVVPTFNESVTNGYLNFADAYVPVSEDRASVASQVAASIDALHALKAAN